MASVLSTRNPAAAPSPTAASTAAPTTPPLFSAHTPPHPRGRAGCACADPSSPPAFPTKALSTESPVLLRSSEWVGGVGGFFAFPPDTPHPSSDPRRALSQPVVPLDHPPNHLPLILALLFPALWVPAKLLWCGLRYTMPGFPSMTPGSQTQRSLVGSLTATKEWKGVPLAFVFPSTIHPCGPQTPWEHLLPQLLFFFFFFF